MSARYDIWDPFEGMDRMRRHMRRMLRGPFELERDSQGDIVREPLIDVVDKGSHYEVIAELPGVEKKDIELNVMPDHISIGAEIKSSAKEEKEGMYFHERSYQKFYRQIPFAEEVKTETANAELKNGILNVSIEKKVPSQAGKGRKVEVQ